MFTGIIEEKGKVCALKKFKDIFELEIEARLILEDLHKGDSVCVNGVCLTVTKIQSRNISFDIMRETIESTTLGTLKSGNFLNLERALKANSRFGGHFVTGHVDTIAKIMSIKRKGKFIEFQIKLPLTIKKYLVPKGSICVDGISLTIGRVRGDSFSVFLIPYTMKVTTLGDKRVGDMVNLEADILAKYVFGEVKGNFKKLNRILLR